MLCVIVDLGRNTAYSLAAEQTPPTERIPDGKKVEKIDDSTRIDFYLNCMKEMVNLSKKAVFKIKKELLSSLKKCINQKHGG